MDNQEDSFVFLNCILVEIYGEIAKFKRTLAKSIVPVYYREAKQRYRTEEIIELSTIVLRWTNE